MKVFFGILLILGLIALIPPANAENVPDWVKNTAGWWASDAISETEFVNAIEFLIKDGIIQVESSQSSKNTQGVPDWVKNTAGWWASDAISETEFVNAIEFLVAQGIINIQNDCIYNEVDFPHLESFVRKILCDEQYDEEFFNGKVKMFTNENDYINKQSFRGSEFLVDNSDDDTFRIFMVGGSTTYGWGVSDEDTISNVMQEELNSLGFGKQIEVINAGIGGAWSKDETNLVKNKISKFEPDMIIVYDGWNDSLKSTGNILTYDSNATPLNWLQRWDEICKNFNQEDIDIIITIQPVLNSSGQRVFTDHEHALQIASSSVGHGGTLVKLDEFAEQLDNFKHCKNTHDLRGIFDNVVHPIFLDTGHVGKVGNIVVSYEILSIIKPLIEDKIGKSIEESDLEKLYKLSKILPTNNKKISPMEFNFIAEYLSKIDFSNETIDKHNFKGATIMESKFMNAVISNSNLRFTVIDNGILTQTEIMDSLFARSVIYQSELNKIIIQDSNFSGSQFNQINILDSEFRDSNFSGAAWGNTRMENSKINNIDLSNSFLKEFEALGTEFISTKFESATMLNSLFGYGVFKDVNFKFVNFSGTKFFNSEFSDIDFLNVDFAPKAINNVVIPGTHFENSNFDNINFEDSIFNIDNKLTAYTDQQISIGKQYTAKIINSDLSDVDFTDMNLNFVDFTNSDLKNANLKDSTLRFSNLEGANLEGANLEGANLEGANLEGANLEGANLEGANLEGANLKCIGHEWCN